MTLQDSTLPCFPCFPCCLLHGLCTAWLTRGLRRRCLCATRRARGSRSSSWPGWRQPRRHQGVSEGERGGMYRALSLPCLGISFSWQQAALPSSRFASRGQLLGTQALPCTDYDCAIPAHLCRRPSQSLQPAPPQADDRQLGPVSRAGVQQQEQGSAHQQATSQQGRAGGQQSGHCCWAGLSTRGHGLQVCVCVCGLPCLWGVLRCRVGACCVCGRGGGFFVRRAEGCEGGL